MSKKLTNVQKTQYILRLILIALFVVIVIWAMVMFAPDVIRLLKQGDQQAMQEYISQTGKRGIIILVTLQVLQTVTIFFPGIPIYMCSGIVYGRFYGTLLCYVTYVVTNCTVFLVAQRMKDTADALFDVQKQSKVESLMRKTGHPVRMVALLCVMPIIPNGIIPYIAANTKLTFKQFIYAVSVGCVPGIFLFVCCGDLLMSEYFVWVIVLMVVAIALMIVGLLFKDKMAALADCILEKIASKDAEK